MMSESLIVVLVLVLMAQSSSLWSSLITIPLSLISICLVSSMNIFSGLLVVIYVMIFIGGLLVLLVSMASISYQEQSHNFLKFWIFISGILSTPFLFSSKLMAQSSSLVSPSLWFTQQSTLVFFLILLISFALINISMMILVFKGLIRSV